MRYAIFSDIHSNIEAFESALIEAKKIGFDKLICLGDIIGYGPNPGECLDLIFDSADHIVLGNHDEVLFNMGRIEHFSKYAKESIIWTLGKISEKYLKKLQTLDYSYTEENVLFVHSNPTRPESWEYIYDSEGADRHFDDLKFQLVFIGHSHIPAIYQFEKSGTSKKPIRLNRKTKTIINVGSVGQPRDGDPYLSFGMFDSEKYEYKNIRLKYNVHLTYEKILASGLPNFLAERLLIGR